MLRRRLLLLLALTAAVAGALACRGEGYDVSQLPSSLRPDYQLFAQRCSKCHSLARPLLSGIDDDAFWEKYVERMRMQPGSGISVSDKAPILRFLRFYAAQQRERKTHSGAPSAAPSAAPPSEPGPSPDGGLE
jgi:hypothetical protein